MARTPFDSIARQVRGNRIEPGREFLPGIEFRAMLVNANERLLSDVGSIILILELPDEVMKQPLAVPFHQAIQGGVMSLDEPLHFRSVLLLGGGLVHAISDEP